MARYVVLEFADNKEADGFVDAFEKGQVTYTTLEEQRTPTSPGYRINYIEKPAAAVGYYMRPTQVCDCPPPPQNRIRGISQGSKYGLWVHSCGKVLSVAMEHWGHHPGLGRNLLIDNDRMKEIDQEGKHVEGLLRIDGSIPPSAIRKPEDHVNMGKQGYRGSGR